MKIIFMLLLWLPASLSVLAESPRISTHVGEGCGDDPWPHEDVGLKIVLGAEQMDLIIRENRLLVYDPIPWLQFELVLVQSGQDPILAYTYFDPVSEAVVTGLVNFDSYASITELVIAMNHFSDMRSPQFFTEVLSFMQTKSDVPSWREAAWNLVYALFCMTNTNTWVGTTAPYFTQDIVQFNGFLPIGEDCRKPTGEDP